MSKVIVYEQANGQVATVTPTDEYLTSNTIEQLVRLVVPASHKYKIVDTNKLPDAADFFDAWVFDENNNVVADLSRAKGIKQQQIRRERAVKFEKLDIEFMRALEIGDTAKVAEISAKKQSLRDATTDPAIINATSIDELRAAVPTAFLS